MISIFVFNNNIVLLKWKKYELNDVNVVLSSYFRLGISFKVKRVVVVWWFI